MKEFWDQVQIGSKKECWIWFGSPGTYGRFKGEFVHRLVLEWKLKRKLKKGEWSLHKCDNPRCVNPAHLFLGNALANSQDMVRKGRQRFLTGALITPELVHEIRARYKDGLKLEELSEIYKVGAGAIWYAVRGKTWKNVGGPIESRDMRTIRNGGDRYENYRKKKVDLI
jgi:hypothetical protein